MHMRKNQCRKHKCKWQADNKIFSDWNSFNCNLSSFQFVLAQDCTVIQDGCVNTFNQGQCTDTLLLIRKGHINGFARAVFST